MGQRQGRRWLLSEEIEVAAEDDAGIETGNGGRRAGLVGGDGVLVAEDSIASGGGGAGQVGPCRRRRWRRRTTGGGEREGRLAEAADPGGAEGPGALVKEVVEAVLRRAASGEVEVAALASDGAL